jgi:hypothetical protein
MIVDLNHVSVNLIDLSGYLRDDSFPGASYDDEQKSEWCTKRLENLQHTLCMQPDYGTLIREPIF